jgi:hypothetical protein
MRGPAGALRRASWSPWAALVVAAPVGTTVATFRAAPGTTACQLRRNSGSNRPLDELDAVRVGALLDNTRRLDGNHGDPFDPELRFGTHYVTSFCPAI